VAEWKADERQTKPAKAKRYDTPGRNAIRYLQTQQHRRKNPTNHHVELPSKPITRLVPTGTGAIPHADDNAAAFDAPKYPDKPIIRQTQVVKEVMAGVIDKKLADKYAGQNIPLAKFCFQKEMSCVTNYWRFDLSKSGMKEQTRELDVRTLNHDF